MHYAEPWCSTSDIQSGDRWGNELAKVLQETKFGVLCVTSDNLNAPWLLFEAGALAKSIDDARVIPLLLDLEKSDLAGPLTQFQAEKADKEGVRRLAESLNKASATPIEANTLGTLFEALWPALEEKIAAIPSNPAMQRKIRPQAEVLEELVAGVRSVEMRVRDIFEGGMEPRLRRSRKMHPEMLMEMRHNLSDGPNDPILLLISASLIRDDAPWLYELAMDAYRTIQDGDRARARPAFARFQEGLHLLMRGPFRELFSGDSKLAYFALREAMEFVPNFGDDLIDQAKTGSSRKLK